MIRSFSFAATPHIYFGVGKRHTLPSLIQAYGQKILLITGAASFDGSPRCKALEKTLAEQFLLHRESLSGEPSPAWVDDVVARYQHDLPDCVIAIGGGGAGDAGKAVAGL